MTDVAVVQGGRSLERDISLRSGHHVAAALRHLGHNVIEADVDEHLTERLTQAGAAFLALHGRDGEDGTIQWVLESLGVTYTGSGPVACQISFDKSAAKGLLSSRGIATPRWFTFSEEAVRHMGAGAAVRSAADRLGFPLVVKPVNQGSALGLAVVHGTDELSRAVITALDYGDSLLLESMVHGRELAVSVLGTTLRVLPPVEIRTRGEVFGFESRPTVSPGAAEYLCPAPLDSETLDLVSRVALDSCATLGVRDFARVDMILDDDGPQVLDLKTCPGLTETSLLPLAAAEAGMAFERLVDEILAAALTRSSNVS